MDLPQPGGAMKKMQFEFADANDATQTPQPAPGAVMPQGIQQPIMPAAMQQPQDMQGMQGGGMPQGGGQDLLSALGGGGMGGAPDSSMFSDEDLAMMVQDDPSAIMGEDMSQAALEQGPEAQQIQLALMEAARRRMGAF